MANQGNLILKEIPWVNWHFLQQGLFKDGFINQVGGKKGG